MRQLNSSPKISVIIPAYNSENYILETIDSVLFQSYQNFEIIIVDDSSTDNTKEIVENAARNDDRIKFFKIEHAGRPAVPRNFGIKKSTGKFIAFLDSDDKWDKYKLEEQLFEFENNPDLIFIYSMSITFGTSIFSKMYEVLPLLHKAARNYEELISKGNSIPLSSVLVRKDMLISVDGFDEDPQLQIEDYDLWLRLSKLGSFIFLPVIHTYYRVHSSQFSGDWETKIKRLEYLSNKRNINLPNYRFYRKKNFIFRMARNLTHLATFLWIKFITLFRRRLRK